MKFRYIVLSLLSLCLLSCNTAWDKYFNQVGEYEGELVSPLNLLGYLKTQEDYSEFVGLLQKTGMDSVLTKNQVLTVWVMPNGNIPEEIKTADQATVLQFVKNHINNVALYKSKLGVRKVHTLAGKIVQTGYADQIYSIDGVKITRMNQICQNGVVHELKDGVLTPKKNIFEYMVGLGDECSIFRDTLFRYNDTVFDRENSLPIGENELGNTIYDSVFVIQNLFFRNGDLRDEETELTLFLPTNDVVKSMLISVSNFFSQSKIEFTAADTNRIMTWMLKSVIHSGRRTSYPTGVTLRSVFGMEWRTDKEFVKEDYTTCSNGNVYIMSSMVFPRKEYMETLEIRPYYALLVDKSKRDEMIQASEGVTLSIQTNTYGLGRDVLVANMPSSDRNMAWIQFQAIVRNVKGIIEAKKVMPGIYTLSASYKAYSNKKVKLYAVYEDQEGVHEVEMIEIDLAKRSTNGTIGNAPYNNGYYEFIPLADAGKEKPAGGRNGLVSAKFEIKQEWGYGFLKFKLVNTGDATVMNPEYFLLEPTADNY